MSIRIVSEEQIRFDIDIESYNRIVREVTSRITASCEQSLSQIIAQGLSQQVLDNIHENLDMSSICNYVAQHISYSRVVDLCKSELIANLLVDSRFTTLVNRGITNSTIGVINETVERVSVRMLEEAGRETDV